MPSYQVKFEAGCLSIDSKVGGFSCGLEIQLEPGSGRIDPEYGDTTMHFEAKAGDKVSEWTDREADFKAAVIPCTLAAGLQEESWLTCFVLFMPGASVMLDYEVGLKVIEYLGGHVDTRQVEAEERQARFLLG